MSFSNVFAYGAGESGGGDASLARGGAGASTGGRPNDLSAVFEIAAGMPFASKENVGESLRALGEAWPMVFATLVAAFYVAWHPRIWVSRARFQSANDRERVAERTMVLDDDEYGGDCANDAHLAGA